MSPTEFLVHNARIHPVDPRYRGATAFVVRNSQFEAVGSSESLKELYPNLPSLDAGGRTIVPGFVDAHAHLHELGRSLCRADLKNTSSPEAVVERLQAYVEVRDLPPNAWLRGHGWDQNRWSPPKYPTRHHLDAVFPDRPVWLTRIDVHAGWANTKAIEATIGLDTLNRRDDPKGGHICRDDDGEATGVLIDNAMGLVEDRLPLPSGDQEDSALRKALDCTARHGITSVHDAGVGLSELRRFQKLIAEDAFPIRVHAMIKGLGEAFDTFRDDGPLYHPSERLGVASVKFFADGALGSRGAALLSEYSDEPGNRGLLQYSRRRFEQHVRAAVEAGFQVCTHAIGDRANRFVLDTYEAVAAESETPLRRPRIEHAQVVHPNDRGRFTELGITASVQPVHMVSDMGWVQSRLGRERLNRAYAWKSLQTHGVQLAFGSDAPVDSLDPLQGIHAAVARRDRQNRPEGGWHPDERLSRGSALKAYTLGGAYAAFQEDAVGSISPGKRADWVVLSKDIMTIPVDTIPEVNVIATYLDGRCIYSTPDWPDP